MRSIAWRPARLESPAFGSSRKEIGAALEANRVFGTIYSGIRLNHAECPFEKVLYPSLDRPEAGGFPPS